MELFKHMSNTVNYPPSLQKSHNVGQPNTTLEHPHTTPSSITQHSVITTGTGIALHSIHSQVKADAQKQFEQKKNHTGELPAHLWALLDQDDDRAGE
jgi:hypothetical protein